MQITINKREEANDYHRQIAALNETLRVITCRNGIQWILQRKSGQRHGETRWISRSYCTTKKALIRAIHAHTGENEHTISEALAGLSDRITPSRGAAQ